LEQLATKSERGETMKEGVVFEANVPVAATLAYADGLQVQGRFVDQVMYSLTDGRVMYVPPIVRDRLLELGIRQNNPFAICRTERREAIVALSTGLYSRTRRPGSHGAKIRTPRHGDRRSKGEAVRGSTRRARGRATAAAGGRAAPPVPPQQRLLCVQH